MLWLIVAVVAAAGAAVIGWPVVHAVRARRATRVQEDRYLAWRGRAAPPSARGKSSYDLMSGERVRAGIAAALGAVALIGLLLFLAQS